MSHRGRLFVSRDISFDESLYSLMLAFFSRESTCYVKIINRSSHFCRILLKRNTYGKKKKKTSILREVTSSCPRSYAKSSYATRSTGRKSVYIVRRSSVAYRSCLNAGWSSLGSNFCIFQNDFMLDLFWHFRLPAKRRESPRWRPLVKQGKTHPSRLTGFMKCSKVWPCKYAA